MNKVHWIPAIIILMLPALFVMKYTAVPYTFYEDDIAVLKVAFQHSGERVSGYDDLAFLRERGKEFRKKLKEQGQVKMSLKSKAGANRERFPISLTVFIDDKKVAEKDYPPSGTQKDMSAVVYRKFDIDPGRHKIRVIMTDAKNEDTIPYEFEETVNFDRHEVKVITFDQNDKKIVWSEKLKPVSTYERKKN